MLGKIIGAVLVAQAALMAHTGAGETSGFMMGFGHPLGGADHILAMVAVGLWAAQMGGRALWAVPVSFVGMMVVGAALGVAGVEVPLIEAGILASVVVLGALVGFGVKLPVVISSVIVGLLAIFHGHAHGAEMPLSVGGYEYAAGFVLATALLHAVGIALVITAQRVSRFGFSKIAGGAIVAGGAVLALS